MRKGAYTLIEIIIVLAIITIIASATVKVCFLARRISDDMTLKNTSAEIVNILSLGKEYCYNKEVVGRVYINSSENSISLIDDRAIKNKYIKKVYLPKGYEFLATFNISISARGVLGSDSINFKDNSKEYHKVTVAVGVDIISVY